MIPDWLINKCRIGAIGIHGSADGITLGRGRSPENWALILNEKVFSISIFKIDSGIVSGNIIDTMNFHISGFDDIASSRYKMISHVGLMLIKLLGNPQTISLEGSAQLGEPRYLPQRIPSDGEIDWNRSAYDLYNFIRALTRPYPGSFSFINRNQKLFIWKSIVLTDFPMDRSYKHGEIISSHRIDQRSSRT